MILLKTMTSKMNDRTAEIFDALSHPLRLTIVRMLDSHTEMHVNDIRERSKYAISNPGLSIHLGKLLKAGIVKKRQEGTKVFYSLSDKATLYLQVIAAADDIGAKK